MVNKHKQIILDALTYAYKSSIPEAKLDAAIAAVEAWQESPQQPNAEGLLPCPFCGSDKAEVDRTGERHEYSTGGPNSVMQYGYYAYCTNCGVATGIFDTPPSTPEEATEEWNRRAPRAAARPQAEQLPIDVAMSIEDMCKAYWEQHGPTETWQTVWRWLAKSTQQPRPTTEAQEATDETDSA